MSNYQKYAIFWVAFHSLMTLILDGLLLALGWGACLAKIVMLLIPLGLIYFSDSLGAFRGPAMRFHYVDEPTPGCAFILFGWVILGGIFLMDVYRWLFVA